MLARTAERMYWLARYMERTENIARLVGVSWALTLDLPKAANTVWQALPVIIDSRDEFDTHFSVANQTNVSRFMVIDERNSASLICSIKMARENVRTTREILPSEVWEVVNELYHFVREHGKQGITRADYYEFLDHIQAACHQFTGMLLGTMSHSEIYRFVQLGRAYERADMTTRIIDVGASELLVRTEQLSDAYENILWMNVLRSLGAHQMYRQHVQDRVNSKDVLEFLFKDEAFPRSVAHCITAAQDACERLPLNEKPLRTLAHLRRVVNELNISELIAGDLHGFIDQFQLDYGTFHDEIYRTWFGVTELAQTG